jgi:pimeloyl-ACP methyl ester carboxylesterase
MTDRPQVSGPTSRFFVSQRLRLHYVDWGNPDAPPLVMVHGGRDHSRNWDWVASALARDWHIIAPDLRGHGDSAWTSDGSYGFAGFIADLAQLVDQQRLAPVTLMGHSLGGNICVRYTGIYPDRVKKLVAIEGLGLSAKAIAERGGRPIADRMQAWIDEQRGLSSRLPHRYPSIDEALKRMQEQNPHLSPEQARHLTQYGVNQNEDGTYSWKFDNYFRSRPPFEMTADDIHGLWRRVTCPALLVHGKESWASSPLADGRAAFFSSARVVTVEGAGHWVHHDRLDLYLELVRDFLAG